MVAERHVKRRELMNKEYGSHIERALNIFEESIRNKKESILQDLKNDVHPHRKTAQVLVYESRTFDFSKVNRGKDYYDVCGSYRSYALCEFPESFILDFVFGEPVGLYALWRYTNFCELLSARLKLPENMRFEVRSKLVCDDERRFKTDKVSEYYSSLYLVYCFD